MGWNYDSYIQRGALSSRACFKGGDYMTWEIVVGIITIVGAVLSITKIVKNNTTAMTEVRCSVDELNRNLTSQNSKIEKLENGYEDHEKRLIMIESKEELK